MKTRLGIKPAVVTGLAWLAVVLWGFAVRGSDDGAAKHGEVAKATFAQLLSAMDKPPMYDTWPPKLNVVVSNECNAYATLDTSSGKPQPVVVVYTGEIEKVGEFNSDYLAFTLGHELGHLALGNVKAHGAEPPSEIVSRTFHAATRNRRRPLRHGFDAQGQFHARGRDAEPAEFRQAWPGLYIL